MNSQPQQPQETNASNLQAGTRPYQLLIFDWDGTLMDSVGQIVTVMQDAIVQMGLPQKSDREVSEVIGLGLSEALMALFPGYTLDDLMGIFDRYRAQYNQPNFQSSELFDGVRETLADLSGMGYALAVATGKSRKGLDRVLAETGLEPFFVATRCADETVSKPDPLMLYQILEETGFSAEQAVMIGDTEFDLAMAATANITPVGVSCGVHDDARMKKSGAVDILPMVRDLPEWLANQ